MSGRLNEKVVVITGAGSGIGAAAARRFSAEGARLVLADINEQSVTAVAAELDAVAVVTDVTREADVERAVAVAIERFGRIDCMVNNAGSVGAIGSIMDTDAHAWQLTMNVLLNSVFFGIKHAARQMLEQGSGVILNVSSIAGVQGGLGPHAYTAAKHAVIGLTKSAASELSPLGIRVNAIAPGTTVTPLIEEVRGGREAAIEGAAKVSPLGSALMPEEIAAGLLYLASDEAAHVTAHTLVIDSGVTSAGSSASALFHSRTSGFMGKKPTEQ